MSLSHRQIDKHLVMLNTQIICETPKSQNTLKKKSSQTAVSVHPKMPDWKPWRRSLGVAFFASLQTTQSSLACPAKCLLVGGKDTHSSLSTWIYSVLGLPSVITLDVPWSEQLVTWTCIQLRRKLIAWRTSSLLSYWMVTHSAPLKIDSFRGTFKEQS